MNKDSFFHCMYCREYIPEDKWREHTCGKSTLSEHNEKRARQQLWDQEHAHLASVLCDDCNTEMHYSEPHAIIDSDPSKRWVFCPNSECSQFKERKLKTV